MDKSQSTVDILEIQFPENVKSKKERKDFKLKKLMEMPETLTADYKVTAGVKGKCDLISFTKSPGAWHKVLCDTYKNVKKGGISKGRQLTVDDDDNNNCKLTINVYHNGTVMIQGSEISLDNFQQSFSSLVKLVHNTTDNLIPTIPCSKSEQDVPKANDNPNDLSSTNSKDITTLRNALSTLERQFVDFKETNLNGKELNILLNTQKMEIQTLRCGMKELEENNLALERELRRLRDEHLIQIGELQRDVKDAYLALQTAMSCLSDEHFGQVKELQRDLNETRLALQTGMGCLSDEHLRHTEELQRDFNAQRKDQNVVSPAKPQTSTIQHQHKEVINTSSRENVAKEPRKVSNKNPEVVLLSDSNGKFLNMNRLFPTKRAIKLWCPTTESALELLDDKRLKEASHIIIHTGTNDLTSGKNDIGLALTKVATKANATAPSAKIIMSTLLPRLDKSPQIIQKINEDLQKQCAHVPQVHLVRHPGVQLKHMYDHIHLNKAGVAILAKALKDTALDRKGKNQSETVHQKGRCAGTSGISHLRPVPSFNHNNHQKSPTQGSSSASASSQSQNTYATLTTASDGYTTAATGQTQDSYTAVAITQKQPSYASVVAKEVTPLDQNNEIRDMLALICSKLLM